MMSKNIVEVWRIQGFSDEFKNDFVEVGNYGEPLHIKWLSDPDTINPIFVKPLILKQLYARGLTKEYIQKNFLLEETGARRWADYYKKERKIVDCSRIAGYYKYRWLTNSWIDKISGGLKIKLYFTYSNDYKTLELVRIGTSTSNFYENINLHPITKVIDFNSLMKVDPLIDATKISFKLQCDGEIIATFTRDKWEYEIDVETGNFKKKRIFKGMTCMLPYDRHLYQEVEWYVNTKRKKR